MEKAFKKDGGYYSSTEYFDTEIYTKMLERKKKKLLREILFYKLALLGAFLVILITLYVLKFEIAFGILLFITVLFFFLLAVVSSGKEDPEIAAINKQLKELH